MAPKTKSDLSLPLSIQEQEELRRFISDMNLLDEVNETDIGIWNLGVELLEAYNTALKTKNTRQRPTANEDAVKKVIRSIPVFKFKLETLKEYRNGKKDLLDKLISDRKSMEISDPKGGNPFQELAGALAEVLKK